MKSEHVVALFSTLQKANPNPTSELNYHSFFELLVAVALSAQATDVSVNRITPHLFSVANTPEAMIRLGELALREKIRSIGLFNTKAKNIIALSHRLVDHFKGQVPKTMDDLQSLPGVGRKTANVILNVAFGQPTLAVDTHVFRVANRTGLSTGKTPEKVENGLMKVIPDGFLQHAHHWLILQGRHVCKARKPLCDECLIGLWCASKGTFSDGRQPSL